MATKKNQLVIKRQGSRDFKDGGLVTAMAIKEFCDDCIKETDSILKDREKDENFRVGLIYAYVQVINQAERIINLLGDVHER